MSWIEGSLPRADLKSRSQALICARTAASSAMYSDSVVTSERQTSGKSSNPPQDKQPASMALRPFISFSHLPVVRWPGVSSIVHKAQLGKAALPSPSAVTSSPAVSSRNTTLIPSHLPTTLHSTPRRSQFFPTSEHRCQRRYLMIQLSLQTLALIRISPLPMPDHTKRCPSSPPAAPSFLSPH